MKIDKYSFGRIVIGGKPYTNDVIIFHDRVRPEWWRRDGHSLHRDDLEEIVAAGPSTLILGSGALGVMRVPEETRNYLAEHKIRLVTLRTGAACKEYNKHADDPTVVGAFHLTC